MSFDLLIRGATVFAAGEEGRLDVGVSDGRIVGPPEGRLLIPAIETESP